MKYFQCDGKTHTQERQNKFRSALLKETTRYETFVSNVCGGAFSGRLYIVGLLNPKVRGIELDSIIYLLYPIDPCFELRLRLKKGYRSPHRPKNS